MFPCLIDEINFNLNIRCIVFDPNNIVNLAYILKNIFLMINVKLNFSYAFPKQT